MSHRPKRERVAILGSTGSVGCSTLDVIARHPDRFVVTVLTAHSNVARLLEQIRLFRPAVAVMVESSAAAKVAAVIASEKLPTRLLAGPQALVDAVSEPDVDTVMAAIVGGAGLSATLAAARAGKKLLLANKEALVLSGALLIDAVRQSGAVLLPIDSEHNAIFQCWPNPGRAGVLSDCVTDGQGTDSRVDKTVNETGRGGAGSSVRHIWLTASGGPFLERSLETFGEISPAEACAHPNWSMGRKISVDSATMMNKALEVIEAYWLFALAPEQIRVVIHPQSIIHSMVAYADGSVLAQMGHPDMRTPIAHALAWPERIDAGVPVLEATELMDLSFRAPCEQRFPCLPLAYQALRLGGTACAALNAANEVAVSAFLDQGLAFDRIASVAAGALNWWSIAHAQSDARDIDRILAVDRDARAWAREMIEDPGRLAAPLPIGGRA
ncbi:MAG: 1-deoxy-D-xylulose-5-phosphate reductoisomerase [Thioalkalivibrionaceae bacterium]